MEEHYGMDRVVTPDEVRKANNLLNDHARAWVKTMSIGEASGGGQRRRCQRALITNFSMIPSLQGLRKDHKPDLGGDPTRGPKLRPLAAANKAPNAVLANLMAQVTKAVGDNLSENIGAEVISTENLKREFEDLNKRVRQDWARDVDIVTKLRERNRDDREAFLFGGKN